MKKKLSTNDILNELGFTQKEKNIFLRCIQIAKDEQKNETINAENCFEEYIKEVLIDEI